MTEKKNKDGKKQLVGTGTLDVVYMEEIRPFEEKFKEICDFFYRGGWITKKEYNELLNLLNQSKGKVKEND